MFVEEPHGFILVVVVDELQVHVDEDGPEQLRELPLVHVEAAVDKLTKHADECGGERTRKRRV